MRILRQIIPALTAARDKIPLDHVFSNKHSSKPTILCRLSSSCRTSILLLFISKYYKLIFIYFYLFIFIYLFLFIYFLFIYFSLSLSFHSFFLYFYLLRKVIFCQNHLVRNLYIYIYLFIYLFRKFIYCLKI